MINLTRTIGGGLLVRTVERPGRVLSSAALADLVQDLRCVARQAAPGELAYGVLGGDRGRLDSCVVTVVYRKREPVAFNILSILDADLRGHPVEVLHLGLVMVAPGARGGGLSSTLYGLTCLLLFIAGQGRPLWISNVSQVPAVVGMVAETFSEVFPSPHRSVRQSFDHLSLARQIMRRHRAAFGVGPEAVFDEGRFVIRDAYGGGSQALKKRLEDAARHRNARHNAFCREMLDYQRGDDLLQLGRIDMAAAARYVRRVAPPGTGLGLIGLGALTALQALVLPVVHWLSDDRAWGSLRPWRA